MIGKDMSGVLGTVIFNYAFVITVPSWVNEKKESVSINKSIWSATSIATLFYLAIGLFGAMAFDFNISDDLLTVINDRSSGVSHIIAQVCVYLFPAVALLSSIPVYSIIMRYNLVENNICRKSVANFWAVIFPWLISVFFYSGVGLLDLINWASLLVNGFINFVIPMIIYIVAIQRSKKEETKDDLTSNNEFQVLPHWINPILCASILTIVITTLVITVIGINIAKAVGANL